MLLNLVVVGAAEWEYLMMSEFCIAFASSNSSYWDTLVSTGRRRSLGAVSRGWPRVNMPDQPDWLQW